MKTASELRCTHCGSPIEEDHLGRAFDCCPRFVPPPHPRRPGREAFGRWSELAWKLIDAWAAQSALARGAVVAVVLFAIGVAACQVI